MRLPRAMVASDGFLVPGVDSLLMSTTRTGIRLDEQVAVVVATGCSGIRPARRNDGTLRE